MTSGVFALEVVVGPLAGLINFCLPFFSVGCTMLGFSLSGLGLGPPGILYHHKQMFCAGSPFEVIIVSDGVGAGGWSDAWTVQRFFV